MTKRSRWKGVVAGSAAVAGLLAGPVLGQDGNGVAAAEAAPAYLSIPPFAPDGDEVPAARAPAVMVDALLPALGRTLDEDGLAVQRGGQDDAYANINDARARVTNTSLTNASTGNNTITEGSLSNNSGLPVVVQNSGNGVVIQNTTILNLQLR